MDFTVKDNNGNTLSNLQVTPLSEDQIDEPGANTQAPTGTATLTSSASGSTGSSMTSGTASGAHSGSPTSSKAAAMGLRDSTSVVMPWAMLSIILASLLAGFLI